MPYFHFFNFLKMALHKLCLNDFHNETYTLLAVICRLEDYRLAYLLNKFLGVRFERLEQNIDFKSPYATYSIFEYENKSENIIWNLISNVYKTEKESFENDGLFFELKPKIINFHNLLPELNTVDFLIKINNEGRLINEKIILNKIQQIPHVVTCYKVDLDDIVSNENLIF